jgi:hypothetical protein
MMRSTPLRFTILHFSQRTFTDGLTFIAQSLLCNTLFSLACALQGRVKTNGSPSITATVCSK